MANPTTNYGFVLPTSTDLVTDLPADFDVALQGVDTRLKALQPGTTLGDIAYSSATANTNTRLGIGSTGQVLTVAGGVPTWATAGGSSGPAFFAKRITSQQSISSGVNTKVQYNSEEFDTDGNYDPTTNYRFTPTKSGYYQINCSALMTGGSMTAGDIGIKKNGTAWATGNFCPPNSGYVGVVCSAIVFLNGSSDYVEAFATNYGGGNIETGTGTVFNGVWIRS